MKRSVPKEIPSEVEVSVVKMIVITRDDCTLKLSFKLPKFSQRWFALYCVSLYPYPELYRIATRVTIRSPSCGYSSVEENEAILMSTHNTCFYGEL